jgi:hypothetical protein
MNNMTEKNGHPSMEEILASIRRIIADEPQGASPLIQLKSPALRDPDARALGTVSAIDDRADFELPAIFRNQPAQPEKPTALFGRLTDAIRNASGVSSAEVRGQRPREAGGFDPNPATQPAPQQFAAAIASPSAPHVQPQPVLTQLPAQHWPASEVVPDPALSSLDLGRGDVRGVLSELPSVEPMAPLQAPEPAQASAGWWGRPAQPARQSDAEDVKRVMVPFRDTRMSRMGATAAYSPPSDEPAEHAAEPVLPAPVLSAPVLTAPEPPLPPPAAPAVIEEPRWSEPVMLVPHVQAPVASHGPRSESPAMGSVEDATADLLRPMLRQWLAENMPRMVEKALHIEVAESVKTSRRPAGSES